MTRTDGSDSQTESAGRLNSWKEIANYLDRSARCVQQWESEYGLPVHRLNYKKRASVYAYTKELDAWRTSRGAGLEAATPAGPPRETHWGARRIGLAAAAFALVTVTVVVAWIWRSRTARTAVQTPVIRRLAVGPGNEIMPAFAPDGSRVAYVSDSGNEEDEEVNTDIYIKEVDADTVFRLTNDPRLEWAPQWSPDGQFIAFYRPPEVLIIPAIGGREKKLGETTLLFPITPLLGWTSDGWGVIATNVDPEDPGALYLLPVDMSPKVRITRPPAGAFDLSPVLSPDGRTLAFTRNTASLANNILLLPMEGHRPAGPPRQLTFNNETTVFYQTWAQDGRSLFCLRARPEPAVIRIYVDPSRPPDLVPQILPAILNYLAASPVHNRLAWSTAVYDSDLWRTLTSAGRRPDRPVRIAQTMREEQEPAISPDGASIAFMSARGTGPQMWVADFDGEKPLMIDSRRSHHPSWSPAGTEIAYEVLDRDGTDIYVIGAQGGASRCLTPVPSQALRPTWSRDGRWIYFSASSADGTREIWKVPARGGTMIRVTRGGGFRAEESVDGKTLYFTKEMQQTSLWAMPAAGGSEEKLIDPLVSGEAFQVFEDGIYSIMKSRPDARHELVFYSFRTARLQKVRDMDPRFLRNFAVSPDRQWLVYDTWRHRGGDLMMIEGLQ